MKILDFEKVRSFTTKDFEIRFKKYIKFLEYLKNPQKNFKTVILTGSTGKGTTAEYLAQILMSYKLRIGLYTSPHILKVTERIKVNNTQIPEEKLKEIQTFIIKKVKEFNKRTGIEYTPTFFELLTISAFLYFTEKQIEIAILEVGLGGRLDATNVTEPVLNIITPICKDHTNFLGNTLKKIALEKAEVIKQNSITIIAQNEKSVINIIKNKCKRMNSVLFFQKKDFSTEIIGVQDKNVLVRYTDNSCRWEFNLNKVSIGAVDSSGIAIFAARNLLEKYFNKNPDKSIITEAIKNVHLLARFQILEYENKTFIIDGAHNLVAIKKLISTLKLYNIKDVNLIFSILSDKDIENVLKEVSTITEQIILVRINHPREAEIISVFNIAQKFFKKIMLVGNLKDAIKNCLYSEKEYILITGSFYLCAEVLKRGTVQNFINSI